MLKKVMIIIAGVFFLNAAALFAIEVQDPSRGFVFEVKIDECAAGDKKACQELKDSYPEIRQYAYKHPKMKGWKSKPRIDWISDRIEKDGDKKFADTLREKIKNNPKRMGKVLRVVYLDRHFVGEAGSKQAQKDFVNRVKLAIRRYEVIEEYKKTDDENKKDKLRKELIEILSEDFDIRTRDVKSRIDYMKFRIERLGKELQKRQDNKSAILEQRADMLLEGYFAMFG
jgi:hypothetical protein